MKNTPNIKKTSGLLVLINIAQVLALAVLTIYVLTDPETFVTARFYSQFMLIVIIVVASTTSSLMSLRFRDMLLKSDNRSNALENALSDMERLNNTLRAQRHDFLNHLQVVYGLIEMDEYGDARDYIEKTYNDIQKVSKVLKTSIPAVNALLQAKTLDAEKNGITVEFSATSRLEGLSMPPWELCRVLGNLMDNAIDALSDKDDGRRLTVSISEDLKSFCFKVGDNGPGIPENIRSRIFEPGFTTKGDKGEGMGLAITNDILNQYGGSISLTCEGGSTIFEASVPKQQ